jgi:hypothetical protein
MADSPRQILENYKQIIIDALADSLEKNDRVAKGGLVQSISINIRSFATNMVMEISMADYWKYVDGGRKKGSKMPPIDAMLKHIANRGINYKGIQNTYKNKKGQIVKRKKPLAKEKALRTLAFLIGRGISRKGIKPTNFVDEAFDNNILDNMSKDLSTASDSYTHLTLPTID